MTHRLPVLLTTILLFLAAVPALAQDGPKPDRWRGLVIDESTPDDAIKVLGKPSKDEVGRIRVFDLIRGGSLESRKTGLQKS
jgi:hypothetical protein